MKKNGFTLIELLVIMAILGLVALIAVPTILTVINNSRKSSYDEQERVIVNAARTYMSDHSNLLPAQTAGATYTITVQKLKDEGLLKNINITNPLYGKGSVDGVTEKHKYFDGKVVITYNNGKYEYKYADSAGSTPSGGATYSCPSGYPYSIGSGSSMKCYSSRSNATETPLCTYTINNHCYGERIDKEYDVYHDGNWEDITMAECEDFYPGEGCEYCDVDGTLSGNYCYYERTEYTCSSGVKSGQYCYSGETNAV